MNNFRLDSQNKKNSPAPITGTMINSDVNSLNTFTLSWGKYVPRKEGKKSKITDKIQMEIVQNIRQLIMPSDNDTNKLT